MMTGQCTNDIERIKERLSETLRDKWEAETFVEEARADGEATAYLHVLEILDTDR